MEITSKRVLFVPPLSPNDLGTTTRRIYALAKALSAFSREFEIKHFTFPRPSHTDSLIKYWMRAAYRLHVVSHTWKPDIIHLSKPTGLSFFYLLFRRLFSSREGVVVLDIDDLESAWVYDVPYAFLWRIVGSWLERWAWQKAKAVIAASHFLVQQAQAVRPYGFTFFLPNPAPIKKSEVSHSTKRIVIPTRLLDISVGELITWLQALYHTLPEAPLVVVGSDTERATILTAKAKEAGVPVTVMTHQPSSTYYRLLEEARMGIYVVANTPATRAKCPARLLDMLGLGIPTVAVDIGEAKYILGDAGIVVSPDDNVLAHQARGLWYDDNRRLELSKRAQARAATHFHPAVLARRLANIYTQILRP